MTQTFKVGDRVQVLSGGYGVVTHGPVNSTFGYHKLVIVKQDGDDERAFKTSDLKQAAKFAVGDRVRGLASGTIYTIEAGPFNNGIEDWYATKNPDGTVGHNEADWLTAADPEPAKDEPLNPGDVVRIPRDGLEGADVKARDLLVVKEVEGYLDDMTVIVHAAPGAHQDEWYFDSEAVERVDPTTVAVVDTVAYDLSARYRDRDGDYWTFERRSSGEVLGNCTHSPLGSPRITDYSDSLSYAVENYGPLTRV